MERRNVVVILCDQLRPDFLKLYGCNAIPTPNLDRLAQKGVVFDNAITQSPVCAPARACMMTGRYVSDHGVWTNDVPFRNGLEYLAERMNKLGYMTAAFGKMHHFPPADAKGFQYVRMFEEGRLKDNELYLQWLKARHHEANAVFNHHAYKFNYAEEEYYEYWIASETIEFIDSHFHNNHEQPFLCWISFQGPHTPYDPPQEAKGTVDENEIPLPIAAPTKYISPVVQYRSIFAPPPQPTEAIKVRKAYCEMITEIDRQIGRVLAVLEQLGLMDNTTFIFSADHGDLLGDFGLNQKGPYPYQGQLAIPMILSNHSQIEPGTRSDALVGNIDIPATVLDIAGDNSGIGVSVSLISQCEKEPNFVREVNFSEFCDSVKIVEDHDYRFCYYPFTGDSALFDRKNDPQEINNLSGKPEYANIENQFLKHIVEFQIISKGVRIEAHDFVPETQKGLGRKFPNYEKEFPIAHPISNAKHIEELKETGLSADYNEFCKNKEIIAHYGVYWE